jgi:hypothetical protein
MKPKYALRVFEELVNRDLNPVVKNIYDYSDDILLDFGNTISNERWLVIPNIKQNVMSHGAGIEEVARNYYNAFIDLINKVYILKLDRSYPEAYLKILDQLDEALLGMLGDIELIYGIYLKGNEYVPISKCLDLSNAISNNIQLLKERFDAEQQDSLLSSCVVEFLDEVKTRIARHEHLTRIQLDYVWRVFGDLIAIYGNSGKESYPALKKKVISWNLNYSKIFDYHQGYYDDLLISLKKTEDKVARLRYELNLVMQIPVKVGWRYDGTAPDLQVFLVSYIENELRTLNTLDNSDPLPFITDISEERKKPRENLKLDLSADQVALLLRAGFEKGVFICRSLRQLFNIVVPHISTLKADKPSPDNTRSKAYAPEESDKEVLIAKLESVIDRIREL